MPVSATDSPNNAAAVAAYSTTNTRKPKQTLQSDDFMKLLATQFQSQDPMKPMEDTAFIAQMAQFSALENSNALTKQMALLRSDQQTVTASSMLGKDVTVKDKDDNLITGNVSAVETSEDGPQLVINGTKYDLASVQRVGLPATSSNSDLPPAA